MKMNPNILTLGFALVAMSISCTKDVLVSEVDFDVEVENNAVLAGDPVKFTFTGTADLITFYSGERGSEYAYRDRVTAEGQPTFEFISVQQNELEDQTLQVVVSADFNGVYDEESVRAATWTDITSRTTLASNVNPVHSGSIDLSDFKPEIDPESESESHPVFIGFKYLAATPGQLQPSWSITDLMIENQLADGTKVTVATLSDLAWGTVNVAGSQAWTYNASRLQLSGGTAGSDPNEDWIISQPLQLNRVKRAHGISVKSNPIATQYDFEYTFDTPGTYVAIFEALNLTKWDRKSRVIELVITVQ